MTDKQNEQLTVPEKIFKQATRTCDLCYWNDLMWNDASQRERLIEKREEGRLIVSQQNFPLHNECLISVST